MFEEIATDDPGYCDWLLDSASADGTAILNPIGIDAGVPQEITFHRNFCEDLIADLNCPCRTASPDPVACLELMGVVDMDADIILPMLPPRAARTRRRRSGVTRGRSAEPSDGPVGPSPNIKNLRRARP